MNNFEIIILALALVFNSSITYLNAGIVLNKEPFVRKLYYTGITFLFQFLMAGAGIWIGYKTGSAEMRVNMLISLSIMLISGLYVLLTGIKTPNQEKVIDYTDYKVTLFAAMAEGIIPFSIGISIGLLSMHPYLHWLFIGLFLFAGIILSIVTVKWSASASSKLKPGPIGGLLLLAAAIKLALNITEF
jgi:putative Mn2+ efflux pump MntP